MILLVTYGLIAGTSRVQISDFHDVNEQTQLANYVVGVKLPQALAELGLIDEYDVFVQPMLVGDGPTLFAAPSKSVA